MSTDTPHAETPFPKIDVQFSEAWWQANYGAAATAKDQRRLLWERFGDVGLGEEHPAPVEPCLDGGYGDRYLAAFWGCEIVHLPGQAPAALPLPNARERMQTLEVPDLETSPVVQRTFDQAREMCAKHGSCKAWFNFGGPLNNAVSVFGEEILAACLDEPDLARQVLRKMAEANLLILDGVLCRINGVDPATIRAGSWGIGNCPVCMIAPATYIDVVLPVDLWLRNQFSTEFCVHHCGVFDAYAEGYRALRPTDLDIGPDSDLSIARRTYPEARIYAYLKVDALARMSLPEVDAYLRKLVADAAPVALFPMMKVADAGPDLADATVRHLLTAGQRLAR
jgi:hypothetical protein